MVFLNPFTFVFLHTAAHCLQLLKQKCTAHLLLILACCGMGACFTCQVLFHSFLCCLLSLLSGV
jgi:hypothetical protein